MANDAVKPPLITKAFSTFKQVRFPPTAFSNRFFSAGALSLAAFEEEGVKIASLFVYSFLSKQKSFDAAQKPS